MAVIDLKYHALENGLALRLYQLESGKFAVSLWDTDENHNAMMTSYNSQQQAEKAFDENVIDCEKYQ